MFVQMCLDPLLDFFRLLVRNKATGDLPVCLGRNNCLHAIALVPSP